MSVDVKPSIAIARPRSEVARYMFDPRNDVEWTSGVVTCRPLTEGALRKGSRYERVSKFLGREFGYVVDVVDHGDARFVDLRVENPFPMDIRYELEDEAEGTRVTIHTRGEAKGFFRVAGPLLSRMVKRAIERDLANLKARLEAKRSAPE